MRRRKISLLYVIVALLILFAILRNEVSNEILLSSVKVYSRIVVSKEDNDSYLAT